MARTMRAISITAVGSLGQVIVPGALRLHGWILTEVNAAGGIVQFRSAAPIGANTADGPAVVGSPVVFERTTLASADLPVVIDHEGFFLSGGLAITCTSTAKVTGVLLVS